MKNRPRVSLAQWMAVVAVLALDCFLVRMILSRGDERGAVCTVGLAVSLVLIGVVVTRGRLGRFGAGFSATMLLGAIVLTVLLSDLHPRLNKIWNDYYNACVPWLPGSLSDDSKWQPVDEAGTIRPGLTRSGAVVCVLVAGVPLLSFALIGGLLALAFRRRASSTPAPGLTST